jgi:hypothetical protein
MGLDCPRGSERIAKSHKRGIKIKINNIKIKNKVKIKIININSLKFKKNIAVYNLLCRLLKVSIQ